jgi:dTDP-4-dehydrorhamnose reductase
MNVLITGTTGMLGSEMLSVFSGDENFLVFSTSRAPECGQYSHFRLDLAERSYDQLLEWARPDLIIHCAAMTNVDECEKNQILARNINVESVQKLLNAMEKFPKTRLYFISTDAVKSEDLPMANETAVVAPLNYYGQTKLEAEKLISQSALLATAIRTTIVGSKKKLGGISFADRIFDHLKDGKSISLFEDAVFTPISCKHLALILKKLIKKSLPKLLHIAGAEPVSKYEFGKLFAKKMRFDEKLIVKNKIEDAGLTAKRLRDQTLSSYLLTKISDIEPPRVLETINELASIYLTEGRNGT